jgi:hypothetical protein
MAKAFRDERRLEHMPKTAQIALYQPDFSRSRFQAARSTL